VNYADAPTREAAWLATADSLGVLTVTAGGPFHIVQAYWPRTPARTKRGLYVQRAPGRSAELDRFAAQMQILRTQLLVKAWWPIGNGAGSLEAEQAAFDVALGTVLARIAGPLGDKTHGGRFLSVAEDPAQITVNLDDPEHAPTVGALRASIAYWADDPDTPG